MGNTLFTVRWDDEEVGTELVDFLGATSNVCADAAQATSGEFAGFIASAVVQAQALQSGYEGDLEAVASDYREAIKALEYELAKVEARS